MGPAEIAHCQEPGRTGPARPSRAGCRCCGTARPRYPTFTHSSPTGRPGCFAPQVIRVGSPEGRRAHGLTSTVLVERLVPLSGFRKPRLGHQQAAAIRRTLALLEEHPAGKWLAETRQISTKIECSSFSKSFVLRDCSPNSETCYNFFTLLSFCLLNNTKSLEKGLRYGFHISPHSILTDYDKNTLQHPHEIFTSPSEGENT